MTGSLLFLLVLAVLAAVCFYFGFSRKDRRDDYLKPSFRGAFIMAVILSVGWMWHIWNLTQMEPQLSKYVVPYPGAKYTVSYSSFVDDDARWLATVAAPPDTVMKFYLSPNNVPSWSLAEESEYGLVFRKEGAHLAIFVTDEGQRGSGITYILTKQK